MARKIFKNPLFLPVLVLIGIVVFWIFRMNESLWMDEFGTYWAVKDGFRDVFQRSLGRFHQSPFYYLIVFLNSQVFGTSEFALRLPSLAAILGTLALVYKTAEELFDDQTGAYALVICATLKDITLSAISARPYALGLLCCAASFFFLVRRPGKK